MGISGFIRGIAVLVLGGQEGKPRRSAALPILIGIALAAAGIMLAVQLARGEISHVQVSIGVGPIGTEARVPVYATFPNTNSGETSVWDWQMVFDLHGARFISFETPPGAVPATVDTMPACGGILVHRPPPCQLQGLIGWLHVYSDSATTLSLVDVWQCGDPPTWYQYLTSSGLACNPLGFYFMDGFLVNPGRLDSASDVPVFPPPTWGSVKALFR